MDSMRDIQRRIGSVKNTRKITRAMKMVGAAKLRRAQDKAESARPFLNKTRKVLLDVKKHSRNANHDLLNEKDGKKHLYILITGDRGLCGAYNSRAIDKLKQSVKKDEENSILAIGSKGRDYFKKRDYDIVSEYVQIEDYPGFSLARKIGNEVISLFKEDMFDKISLIYTHFESALTQQVKVIPFLPVDELEERDKDEVQVEYLYEPSADEVLDVILPQYVYNVLYSSLLESKASEYGSRMTAMDSATDNANDMIEDLTKTYNRARQAEITTEITEIVSGAEALK